MAFTNTAGSVELPFCNRHDLGGGAGDHLLFVLVLVQPRQDNERAAAEPRGLRRLCRLLRVTSDQILVTVTRRKDSVVIVSFTLEEEKSYKLPNNQRRMKEKGTHHPVYSLQRRERCCSTHASTTSPSRNLGPVEANNVRPTKVKRRSKNRVIS